MGAILKVLKQLVLHTKTYNKPCYLTMSTEDVAVKNAFTTNTEDAPIKQQLSKRAMKRQKRWKYQQKFHKKRKVNATPGFDNSFFLETDYYFENGLRKVYPYYFSFESHAKGRWVGKKLLDVFKEEMKSDTEENYRRCIANGKLTVNGEAIDVDYRIKNNDYIAHTTHRHEVPVTASTIEIIKLTSDLIVVNKPSSIPVHPCGRFRHNSIMFILGKEHGLTNLRSLYRLDRLTSGILIIGRTKEKTDEFMKEIKEKTITKEYVCRVVGEFPSEPVTVSEPLSMISYKVGLHKVCANGKPSSTKFEQLSYNGSTSVVKCMPLTGRTHQIRVHLQYLGHPIVNDMLYRGPAWGPHGGKGGNWGKSEEQLITDIREEHNEQKWWIHDSEEIESEKNDCVREDGLSTTPTIEHTLITEQNPIVNETDLSKKEDDATNLSNKESESMKDMTAIAQERLDFSKRNKEDLKDDSTVNVVQNASEKNFESKPVESHITMKPRDNNMNTEDSNKSNLPNTSDADFCSVDGKQTTNVQSSGSRNCFDCDKMTFEPNCRECNMTLADPAPSDLIMYLHALRYRGDGWEYSTELPPWAHADWKE